MILAAIAKSEDHQCGWANALNKSGKAGSFSPVVLTEQVPPSVSKPKRSIPTEELDKQFRKRRLDFSHKTNETREDNEGVLFINVYLLLLYLW